MQWNFKDELFATSQQVVHAGTPETTYYVYDASGQRARKITEAQNGNKKNERFYLGGFEFYREYASGSSITLERETLHVMDDKQRIALVETQTVENGAAVSAPTPAQRYQLANHLGSACLELDESGGLISYEEYSPFGSTTFQAYGSAEVSLKRYRYTGMQRDEESGLNYHGARYYAMWLGRWVCPDPLAVRSNPRTTADKDRVVLYLSISTFCYGNDNPTYYRDPSGNENIAVAGAKFSDDPDAKLNFVHQAIREIVQYETEDPHESRTLLLFKEGYSEKQIEAIRADVKKHGGETVVVDSRKEFFRYLENGSKEPIHYLDIFSHGVVGSFEFGYKTEKADQYRVDLKNINEFPVERFRPTSLIRSFACRTGLGNAREYEPAWPIGNEAYVMGTLQVEKSLAGELAQLTGATVQAFAVRTFYGNTRGKQPEYERRRQKIGNAFFIPGGAVEEVTPGYTPINAPHDPIEFVPTDEYKARPVFPYWLGRTLYIHQISSGGMYLPWEHSQ